MFTVKCDDYSKPLEKQLEVRKRREVFGNDLLVEVSVSIDDHFITLLNDLEMQRKYLLNVLGIKKADIIIIIFNKCLT